MSNWIGIGIAIVIAAAAVGIAIFDPDLWIVRGALPTRIAAPIPSGAWILHQGFC